MAEPVQDLLKFLKKEEIATLLINASVTDPGLEQKIRELAMEEKQKCGPMDKKRNLAPESSQKGEPPRKQHKSEEEQENLAPESSQIASEIKPFAFSSTTPFGSISGGSSAGKKALAKRLYFPISQPFTTPFQRIGHPACIDEDGGSSGKAMFDSISTFPAFYYDRYESCITFAGSDYCVIAADLNPGQLKFSELSSKCVMASCGFQDDVKALQKALSDANLSYEREHKKPMSCPEMSELLDDLQKCHPNYVFIVLGGLDSEGKGCFFHHYSLTPRLRAVGSRLTVPPIANYQLPSQDDLALLSEEEAVAVAKKVFKSAFNTGDKLEIFILDANGVRRDEMDLKASESGSEARLFLMQQKDCVF